MKEKKQARSKWLTIRLDEAEEKKINRFYSRTTSGSLSEYARDVLLKKPVTILYRNESADEFLSEMIGLKNELTTTAESFQQAVKKLHDLDSVAEIKTWALLNEASKQALMKKVEEIKERLNKFYQLWFPE